MPPLNQDLINHLVAFFLTTVISLTFHEWAHAAVAVSLGDNTPREQGRYTINPVVHIDLLGTILLPIAMILSGHSPLGWAKPVEITPYRFTRKIRLKTGIMLVAAAGPLMNLFLAAVGAIALAGLVKQGVGVRVEFLLRAFVEVNVILFLFNLLPVPPLDGSRVVSGVMPDGMRKGYRQLERFSPVFLMILIFTPVVSKAIQIPVRFVHEQLTTLAQLFF